MPQAFLPQLARVIARYLAGALIAVPAASAITSASSGVGVACIQEAKVP